MSGRGLAHQQHERQQQERQQHRQENQALLYLQGRQAGQTAGQTAQEQNCGAQQRGGALQKWVEGAGAETQRPLRWSRGAAHQ